MRLVADRVVYNEVTREVVADGNVVLDSGAGPAPGRAPRVEHRDPRRLPRARAGLPPDVLLHRRAHREARPRPLLPQRRLLHDLRGGPARLELPRHVDRADRRRVPARLEPDPADQEAAGAVLPLRGLPDQARPLHRPADPDGQASRAPTVSRCATRSTGRRATTSTRPSGSTTWRRPAGGPAARCATCWPRARRGSSPPTTCATRRPTPSAGRSRPATPRSCPSGCTRRSTPSSRATGSSSRRRARRSRSARASARPPRSSSTATGSSWNFDLSGRYEVSLLTENRTTLTRFPELTIDRTSTRLFGTDLFLKVAASGAFLERDLTHVHDLDDPPAPRPRGDLAALDRQRRPRHPHPPATR